MIFNTKEYEERIKKLRIEMEKNELDSIVLTDSSNLFYTSGSEIETGALILPMEKEPILVVTPKFQVEKIKNETWINDIRPVDKLYKDLTKIVKEAEKKKLGFDALNSLPGVVREELQNNLEVPLVDVGNILLKTRETKSQAEIQATKETAALNNKLDQVFFETAKEGISEKEIYTELIYALHQCGGERIHISMTTGFPNYWMHYKPYPRELKDGDLIFCEIAPQLKGYWTETLRMVVIGKLKREFRDLFEIEVAAVDHVIKELRPGAVSDEIYKSLLDFVHETKIALMDYTDTMTHGAGLTLSDLPNIRYDTKDTIKVGQSLCLHPILLFPYMGSEFMVGEHGIITENGCEIITKRQTELIAI